MKITILCSNEKHPVNRFLKQWISKNQKSHEVSLLRKRSELRGGDLLFLVSCHEIIRKSERQLFGKTLVIHASDLPQGRGWSPHIWTIAEGGSDITLSLLEANDATDSGDIWKKLAIKIPKHALWDEINQYVFRAELELMDFAVANFETVQPEAQNPSIKPSYFDKREPGHSEIEPNKSIAEQFDLIRVCDPNRFPAFFKLHGHTYAIHLEKI